ncbi:MAG: hypothetical protein M1821_007458 [Bathelium mastoideum]|nr:MAG: hypothetical protein M1821_007458 [Bathelium mastoideum]
MDQLARTQQSKSTASSQAACKIQPTLESFDGSGRISFLNFPAEIRIRVYYSMRAPSWAVHDNTCWHTVEHTLPRVEAFGQSFTIPDWTIYLDPCHGLLGEELKKTVHAQLALASTCKQLRDEVLKELFSNFTFVFSSDAMFLPKVNRFLETVGPASRHALRHIDILRVYDSRTMRYKRSEVDLLSRYRENPDDATLQQFEPLASYPPIQAFTLETLEYRFGDRSIAEIGVIDILQRYRNDFHPDVEIKTQCNLKGRMRWGYAKDAKERKEHD